MRKWTKSACVEIAWCILPVVMTAGMTGSTRSAQVNHRIASSTTHVTLAGKVSVNAPHAAPRTPAATAARYVVQPGDSLSGIASTLDVPGGWQALYAANRPRVGPNPNVIQPGTVLVLPRLRAPVRYTVAAGDTLSVIAARLAVHGGWRALYAANRRAIGPDPNVIHPGAVLVAPPLAASAPAQAAPAPHSGRRHSPAPAPAPAPTRPPARSLPPIPTMPPPRPLPLTPAMTLTPRVSRQPGAAIPQPPRAAQMPPWLLALLLAAGVLIAAAFVAEPAMILGRRRRRGRQAGKAAGKARIILADHERLIVTYSTADDTVYVLTPPGEDPRAVLRAARLVLSEDTYEELAGHLGVPANWPLE